MQGTICNECKMDSTTRRWTCKATGKDMNTFCTSKGTGQKIGTPSCYVPPKEEAA